MALDDALGDGNSQLRDSLLRQYQPDDGQPFSGDASILTERLARKLAQPGQRSSVPAVDFEPAPEPKAPDLAKFGTPVDPNASAPSGDDLSSFGQPVDPIGPPAPTSITQPATTLGDYPREFGKGVLAGVKDMGASALKGAAALHVPSIAAPDLIDDLAKAGDMKPSERAKLMGRAMRGITDKGLQMDFNAALQRISRGGDAAKETDAIRKRFELNNKAATAPITESPTYQAGQAIEDFGKEALAPKPGFEPGKSWTRDIGQGAGSMAAGILTSMVPGIGPAAAGTLFTAAGMGEAAEKAIQSGATPQQTRQAAALGGVAGATDMVDTLLPMLGSTGKAVGFIKRMGIAAVKGAIMEGGQEGVQQLMQNAIAKGIYKPDQDLFEDVPRSMAIAAILGGFGGGAGSATHDLLNRDAATPAAPGATPGAGPTGPDTGGPSSPEDIADFLKRARYGNRNQNTESDTSQRTSTSGADPSSMSEAEWINAYAESRASHGNASDAEILKATGMSDEDIAGLSENDRIDAVIRAAKPAEPGAEQQQEAPKARPEQASDEDYSVLRAYGYSDEDIENMSERQRRREALDARAEGINTAEAVAKFKRPAPAESNPETAETPSSVAPDKGTGQNRTEILDRESLMKAVPADKDGATNMTDVASHVVSKVQTALDAGKSVNLHVEGKVIPIVKIDGGMMTDAQGRRWGSLPLLASKPGENNRVEISDAAAAPAGTGRRDAPVRAVTVDDVLKASSQVAEPTEAQAKAGNYQMGHLEIPQLGLTGPKGISIETGVGQMRRGTAPDGSAWEVRMPVAYGRIKATRGADGDHIDAFIGPHPDSNHVFILDQRHAGTEDFDEHKVLIGFNHPREAIKAYRDSYADDAMPRIGAVTAIDADEFKEWLANGDHSKRFSSEQNKPVSAAHNTNAETGHSSTEASAAISDVPKVAPVLGGAEPAQPSESPHVSDGASARLSTQDNHNGVTDTQKNTSTPKPKSDDVPLSLLQFLASKGGLKPHGDLTGMDAHRHRVQIPGRKGFFGLVKSDGLPLDMAREAAEEAGYLRGENAHATSTERQLLDLIDAELRGQRAAAEGETLAPTKREQEREQESSDRARQSEIDARLEEIEASDYRDVAPDVKERAAEIMADENMDLDDAIETAAMRLVSEDEDYGVTPQSIADTFGAGAIDEIQPVAASEDGSATPSARKERNRSGQEEKAGRDGAHVPDTGKAAREAGQHYQEVEELLGDDADKVLPVDITRAAELMADNDGMDAATAFQHAVIENAVTQGFITTEEAEQAYGPEVTDILEAGIEGASGSSRDAGQEGAASDQEQPGDTAQGRVVSRGGEAGAAEDQQAGDSREGDEPDAGREAVPASLTAQIAAGESDEVVTVTLTRDGPWDFNDTWPMPDVERVAAMASEGRAPFEIEDGELFDVEQVVGVLDEGLHGIISAIAEVRGIDERIKDIRDGKTKLKRGQTIDDAIKPLKADRAQFGREAVDTAASYEDVFGREAARAMMIEARRRLTVEDRQTPVRPQRAFDPEPQRKERAKNEAAAKAEIAPRDGESEADRYRRLVNYYYDNQSAPAYDIIGDALSDLAGDPQSDAIKIPKGSVGQVIIRYRETPLGFTGGADWSISGSMGSYSGASVWPNLIDDERDYYPTQADAQRAEANRVATSLERISGQTADSTLTDKKRKDAAAAAAAVRHWMDTLPPGTMTTATERTEAGEQTILPGAERISQGEEAQRAADRGLKPKVAQQAADDGLFGDSRNQTDLLDIRPQEPSNGVPPSVSGRDAGPEPENVPPVAGQRGADAVRPVEGGRGASDAGGPVEGRTEGAERPADDAGREGSRGTGSSSDVRVSGRPDDAEAVRGESPVRRDPAAAVKGENYRIEPGALDEARGPKRKAEDNLEAITLANVLTELDRPATMAEQQKLARYVGWGGIKGAFPDADGEFAKGFEGIGQQLKDILSPEEYDTARRSIQYAHYTAEDVIRSMWSAAEQLGFEGGRVFEPGMGVGHFAGMMPADVAEHSQYQGVELDHVTARIAKLLYPQWGVRREDFTRMPLPENSFDLVIGNPPFADIAITSDPKYAQHKFLLHDYFFAKSLDAVRPGGLLMFVTSAGTMNKIDPSARQYMADRADFVGAVRLPGNAFKQNAGTEVTTDIIILRKLMPGEAFGDRTWTQTAEVTLPGPDGKPMTGQISRYFAEHPEMVLGKADFADKLYEGRYSVKAWPGFELKDALSVAMAKLPRNVMRDGETPTERAEQDFEHTEKKDGTYYLKGATLMQMRGGVGEPVARRGKGVEGGKTTEQLARIRGLVPIRDALRATYAADLADDKAAGDRGRKALNAAYDAFTKTFGPINKADIQLRRPSVVQQETARAEAREEARYAGIDFDEGTFDATRLLDANRPMSEIARARREAREAAANLQKPFDEGSFDPDAMPDIIIDKRVNIEPFMDDPESYRLRAIEHYDDTTGKATKGLVFSQNIITREKPPQINSINDAVLYTLNQKGRLDIDHIAGLAGKSQSETIEALGDRIYRVPGTRDTWETREQYLSGNVRKKLALAKKEAARDSSLQRNVDALEAAQPAPLAPAQIHANLGMPWIPHETIESFAKDELGLTSFKAVYIPVLAQWSVSGDTDSVAATTTWGSSRRNATALLSDALNHVTPKIYDEVEKGTRVLNVAATQDAQDKLQAIKDKFKSWIWADDARADPLAAMYNENYNNLVVRQYDGDYLTTPGIASDWKWRPHQTRVIARIIQSGNTYMAHAVGAGKTSAMIGAGMEMRRLGLVKKPMYAVPNHMLAQFTKEFYEQYPTARIAVADDRNFHADRRKQFMANVALDDLDAVIITHTNFGMIPISDEFNDEMIQIELSRYRGALSETPRGFDNRITRSRIEKQIERLEQRLSGKSNRRRDNVFTFDEMGVDFLFVDEAHKFRKLDFSTQMSNLKGITPEGSSMAWDLYAKTKLLDKRNPGRSLVLASGTPVTNTMAELYTVSRYTQPRELEERGLQAFDAWAGAYGEEVSELEQDAAGGYKPVARFAKFVNVAELSAMVRQVMDVVTSRQLEQYVVRPQLKGGKRIMNLAEKSDALSDYQDQLAARMKAMKGRGKPKPGDDIMLTVIGDGRHAAIDMRLVGGQQSLSEPSKLDLLVENVGEIAKRTARQKFYKPKNGAYDMSAPADIGPATQMIFANLGLSGKRGLAVPEYIRAELVRRGVPRDQIALIADYKTHVAKQKLFNDMNSGKMRVLIGSTDKMATGVNAQRRLYAVHNLDPLWFPADDEQRNGRAIRQGNMNPEIEIHDYSTKGTYDSTMWGLMEKKARFIQGFFEGDPSMRDMEDLGEASQYAQAKAMTTNDPRLMRLTELKQDLERALRRKDAFESERYALKRRQAHARDDIDTYSQRVAATKQDIAARQDLSGDNFKALVGKETYTARTEFGDALLAQIDKVATVPNAGRHITIGEVSGFPLVVNIYKLGPDEVGAELSIKRAGKNESSVNGTSALGIVRSIETKLSSFENEMAYAQQRIDTAEKFLSDSVGKENAKFQGNAEIDQLATQVRDLETELSKKEETPAPTTGEPSMASMARSTGLTPAAAAQQDDIIRIITAAIRKMIGGNAKIEFTDDLIEMNAYAKSGYGNIQSDGARGMYLPRRRLIQLALYGNTMDVASSAFHEAYHAVEFQLQNERERDLMKRETPRIREYLRKTYGDDVDQLVDYEVRANAFEQYARERIDGNPRPGEGLHVGVRAWFERLLKMLREIGNGLRGLGFRTYSDIFNDAFNGEYAGRTSREYDPADFGMAAANRRPGATGPDTTDTVLSDVIRTRALGKLGNLNLTEARVKMQDKFIRIKNTEESVGNVPTSQSAYQAESLYYGRTGERLEQLERNDFDPLIKDLKARDISLEQIDDYLYAKHAPERNLAMDAINHPELQMGGRDLRGRGSGMSDEEAQAIMDRIAAEGKTADYEAVEQRVRKIIDDSRDYMVDSGLITQETADAWAAQYQNYVPLRGFEGVEDEGSASRGAGFDTRARETQQAMGRLSKADGPLGYIMMQAESAIVRGEKNRVGNTFYRFVNSNPDAARWTVNKPPVKRVIDKRTGLVRQIEDPNWKDKSDVFVTKIAGRPVLIQMHGPDAQNIVRALKNLGTSNLNSVMRLLHAITSIKSRLSTQWNPDFIAPNFFRDLGEAFINLQAQDQQRFVRNFSKHLFPAIKGAMRGLAGKSGDKYTDAFHEFDKAGGRIRFFGLEDHTDIEKNVNAKLRRLKGGAINNIRDVGAKAAEAFEIVNGGIENATRLAAYMAAREVGMSVADSAMLARNLTVDFNKKGEAGTAFNALYMFGNAAVQGMTRNARSLQNRRVQYALLTLMAMGALSAMFNFAAGGDDDDGESFYSKVPHWIRDKNMIVMWPKGMGHDGEYIKIPLPYGFSPFHVLGDRVAGVVLGQDKPLNAAWRVLASIGDAFNPLGQEDSIFSSILPSIFRPGSHIANNKNWNGNPLYPDNDYNKNKPDSEKSFRSNSQLSKDLARGINSATGGSPYKSGWADWHPGSIDHVLQEITGGLGKFISNTIETGRSIYKGDPVDANKVSIVRRFYGTVKDAATDARSYYESRDEARKNGGDALRQARKDRASGINTQAADEFLANNSNSLRGEQIFKNADKLMTPLREKQRQIDNDTTLSSTERKAALTAVQEQMRSIQNRARRQYKEMKGATP